MPQLRETQGAAGLWHGDLGWVEHPALLAVGAQEGGAAAGLQAECAYVVVAGGGTVEEGCKVGDGVVVPAMQQQVGLGDLGIHQLGVPTDIGLVVRLLADCGG